MRAWGRRAKNSAEAGRGARQDRTELADRWFFLSAGLFVISLFGNGDAGPEAASAVPLALVYFAACISQASATLQLLVRFRSSGSAENRAKGVFYAALTTLLTLAAFANCYYVASHRRPRSFSERLSVVDAFYFATTTFSTTGYGDIAPRSQLCRLLVTAQLLVDLLLVGLIVSAVTALFLEPRERGEGPGPVVGGVGKPPEA